MHPSLSLPTSEACVRSACASRFLPHCRGHAQNGELAYGKTGKKSSANPDTVKALEGAECYQTACGIGHTLFLMETGSTVVSSWACQCTYCRMFRRSFGNAAIACPP